MITDVPKMLSEMVDEATQLRFEATLPSPSAAPQEVLESLQDTRKRLDRTEELLSKAIRIRGRSQRALEIADAEAATAWDKLASEALRKGVNRGNEYTGPREKYADYNMQTLDLQINLRKAKQLVSSVDETVEVLRLLHRGLDGLRQDHNLMLRSVQFLSSLEA